MIAPIDRLAIREKRWSWRQDIRAQIINTDIDGLLTACLLHHLKGWPISGLYDTKRLWLAEGTLVPIPLDEYIWVDIDMCWPGTRSLSQHVVTDRIVDSESVEAFSSTINPSLVTNHSRQEAYTTKYPFGTFQWTWWLALREIGRPDPADRLLTGLAWMADGGFDSINGAWRDNCTRWATELMPGSLLEPLVRLDGGRSARLLVHDACDHLKARSGVDRPDVWRNLQFNLARGSRDGPDLLVERRF